MMSSKSGNRSPGKKGMWRKQQSPYGKQMPRFSTKQKKHIPCSWFRKGNCKNGDKCPYRHSDRSPADPKSMSRREKARQKAKAKAKAAPAAGVAPGEGSGAGPSDLAAKKAELDAVYAHARKLQNALEAQVAQ